MSWHEAVGNWAEARPWWVEAPVLWVLARLTALICVWGRDHEWNVLCENEDGGTALIVCRRCWYVLDLDSRPWAVNVNNRRRIRRE